MNSNRLFLVLVPVKNLLEINFMWKQLFVKKLVFRVLKIENIRKYSVLDCSAIAGMYNNGSVNIIYQNGDLRLLCQNSITENIIGKVKPSCEGFITFGDNK